MEDQLRSMLANRTSQNDSTQHNLFTLTRDRLSQDAREEIKLTLDLGCGTGQAYEQIKLLFPNTAYEGVDIEVSPEVSLRDREDLSFSTYDGTNLDYPEGTFDVIFCRQVLEHVRHPDLVIAEAARVLKPGGLFLGAVSQLEPYHSHSIFNWTAYGIINVFGDHGLDVFDMAPGIDGITLTMRRMFGLDKFSAFFAVESLFNHYIEKQQAKSAAQNRLYEKIVCAGHIIFLAKKTVSAVA